MTPVSELVTIPASYLDLGLRLLLAAMFGGIVGFERETHDRPAGLRTHMLVCVGSALLMVVSITVAAAFWDNGPADPARIAAQVVSGIGFLGAGTILREGATIRGLTTAASLWVVAALGLAAGAGLYVAAGIATVGTVATLSLLSRVENYWFYRHHSRLIRIRIVDKPGQLGAVAQTLGRHGVNITTVNLQPADGGDVVIEFRVQLPKHFNRAALNADLLLVEGIRELKLEEL